LFESRQQQNKREEPSGGDGETEIRQRYGGVSIGSSRKKERRRKK
jgi:hypothetical protein